MLFVTSCKWNPVEHQGFLCLLLDENRIYKEIDGTVITEKNFDSNITQKKYVTNYASNRSKEEPNGKGTDNAPVVQYELSQTFLQSQIIGDNKNPVSKKIYEKKPQPARNPKINVQYNNLLKGILIVNHF